MNTIYSSISAYAVPGSEPLENEVASEDPLTSQIADRIFASNTIHSEEPIVVDDDDNADDDHYTPILVG